MLADSIREHSESVVRQTRSLSNERLKEIIDRPFQPSPFNRWFDLEKFMAQVEKAVRDNGNGDSEEAVSGDSRQ